DLSIYSNVQSAGPLLEVRDQHSGQTVAHVDRLWLGHEIVTLEGRPVSVEWSDGAAVWVTRAPSSDAAERPLYRSARQMLSYDLARALPTQLGLHAGAAPFVATSGGWLWFHFLGACYGLALLDLLRYRVPATATGAPGLALHLPDPPAAPPELSEPQVVQYLRDRYRQYEPMLELGPFQQMLPVSLRRRSVVEQFDVPRFLRAVAALQPLVAPEALSDDLTLLVALA
ncbi:MAG: hypothetical protein H7Y32_06030, partial [Chloroflexales bacterium]|nr:hypothetical protein [Chloroflexales bacterium]